MRILVSDVGGTNGRFAIAEYKRENEKPEIHSVHVLPCRNYPTFSDMVADYLSKITDDTPKIARFAIAGEITPKKGNLWHFNWDITTKDLKSTFGFDKVRLLNDYEALVKAVPYLDDDDLMTITPFKKGLKKAAYSVFGAGTGLGAAIGVPRKSGPKVVSTETGHISFAPKTQLEQKLLDFTSKTIDHVSIETFLSGSGIMRLYEFICHHNGVAVEHNSSREVTTAAANKADDHSIQTVALFFDILSSAAGDIAVAQGARGGVYIGGGIVPKVADLISPEKFLKRFCDKGPMTSYVEKIPVHIITKDMPALLGSAAVKTPR